MDTPPKELGAPIAGEDQGASVTCPAGHVRGLYAHGIRVDLCTPCETQKSKAGDRDAQKRLSRFSTIYQKAKRAQQAAADRASRPKVGPRGARWEPWEPVSAKGVSMGADLTRTHELSAE